jgi:ATP-binding cassette subfamily B protein
VALVGASGAGKSTIFNLILRFYDPANGHILFKGEDLRTLYFDEFRSKVAIVPQDPFMFSTTILENIRLGMHNCTIADIKRAAELSYSLNFIEDLRHGFHTYVGEKGVRLSGGQKQRIALARAILKNPELLLLDEATSSLDSESEHYIKKSLEKFLINKTSITIAHRLSTIRHCDKILLMENGEITAVGHHDELISNNAYYSKLVKMQFMTSLSRQSA